MSRACIWMSVCLTVCLRGETVSAQASSPGPEVIEIHLPRCGDLVIPDTELALRLGRLPAKTDLCFAVDANGSQRSLIKRLKDAENGIAAIVADLAPPGSLSDVRFALISYKDYPHEYVTCGGSYSKVYGFDSDWAFRIEASVGSMEDTVAAFMKLETDKASGADTPSSVARALHEMTRNDQAAAVPAVGPPGQNMGWREGAARIIVNICGSQPHECNMKEGLPETCGTHGRSFLSPAQVLTGEDPGRDEKYGTPEADADNVSIHRALADMARDEVKLVQIWTGMASMNCLWDHWAGLTGGTRVTVPGSKVTAADLRKEIVSAVHTVCPKQVKELTFEADCESSYLTVGFSSPQSGALEPASAEPPATQPAEPPATQPAEPPATQPADTPRPFSIGPFELPASEPGPLVVVHIGIAGPVPLAVASLDCEVTVKQDGVAVAVRNFKIHLDPASPVAPLTISGPGDIEQSASPGEDCAAVTFATTVADACGVAAVVCDHASGDCFPVGTTPVHCKATDNGGREATCTFNVTVSAAPR